MNESYTCSRAGKCGYFKRGATHNCFLKALADFCERDELYNREMELLAQQERENQGPTLADVWPDGGRVL